MKIIIDIFNDLLLYFMNIIELQLMKNLFYQLLYLNNFFESNFIFEKLLWNNIINDIKKSIIKSVHNCYL